MSDEVPEGERPMPQMGVTPLTVSGKSVLVSTLTSLSVVLVLLMALRWVLPPLLEASRYSWYRGQLKAEHEAAGEELRNVSLDGLSRISELVSQRVTPSVVHIDVKHSVDALVAKGQKLGLNLEDFDGLKSDGQGSGVIVDSDGYILTNFHVLEDCEIIEVRFSDDSRSEARIVGFDRARDLAVLKVKEIDLPPITWGDSDTTIVGAPVWAVGSPFGLHGSITFGILSSKHRVDLSDSRYQHSTTNRIQPRYSDLMQSDVAVNPGNSGGPLVNGKGELVGINTAILGESYRGVSFSIPSNITKKIYDEIRLKAPLSGGWLGVQLDDVTKDGKHLKADDESSAIEGAIVVGFANFGQSPARKAGVRRGDIVVGFNKQPIRHYKELIEFIGKAGGGSKVKLEVLRDGSRESIDIELGTRHVELEVVTANQGN
ncbi:MAG: trypsin-like peptidase domain-containing protein [Pirellulaceae bacterium]|nr:trypsin-like peptidase domain-containing protein [Pirellulaceae bacterium]